MSDEIKGISQTSAVANLCCNDLSNPLGVETTRPLLSWTMQSAERGACQTAYRVLVASSPEKLGRDEGDLWDSGKIESDRSTHVQYLGAPLKSRQAASWKIMVWDKDGTPSLWSEQARWEMGLLRKSDWKGYWINAGRYGGDPSPAPMLRTSFMLKQRVTGGRAYICGLGYYELYINGKRVGDEVLAPAFSRYDKTAYYQTWDVTNLLQVGENAIGVILGNGWYNAFTAEVWDFKQAPWRSQPKLKCQFHLNLEDGKERIIASGPEWKFTTGPIVFDGLRNGEVYDARLEKHGWCMPGYDDREWKSVEIIAAAGGALHSQQHTPIRVTATLKPASMKEVRPGVWVFDLGQNIAGWAQLRVSGAAGTEVTLRYAEKILENGDIDQSNINPFIKSGECQTDKYILKGYGEELWEPRFCYHGFQWIQLSGYPGTPTLDSISGRVVHTDFETRGEFSCSKEVLNSIQRCARWSTLGNYHGIPTDCPHREKNGWTGDASLSAEQVLLNFAPETAYRKWMRDFRDCQRDSGQLPGIVPTGGWGFNWGSGPAWDSAFILIPWYLYLYRGDLSVLSENYERIKLYVDYMTSMAVGNIVDFGLGDWCVPHEPSPERTCAAKITDTAYYYVDSLILAQMAELLCKTADAKKYRALAGRIRKSFWKHFVDLKTGQVAGARSQTALACALYQGLVDGDDATKVLATLVAEVEAQKRHHDCGILGCKYLLNCLSDYGRGDLAYAIASQTDYPSWGEWVMRGATTLWEDFKGATSRNHHMFSDISAWFYRALAGIKPDIRAPGFKNVIIQPNVVGDLTWVKAWHRSPYGRIESEWKTKGNEIHLRVVIPPNSCGEIHVPTRDASSVLIDGHAAAEGSGVRILPSDSLGQPVFAIEAGTYLFQCVAKL
jgi:alpha-L-rhamnosidase